MVLITVAVLFRFLLAVALCSAVCPLTENALHTATHACSYNCAIIITALPLHLSQQPPPRPPWGFGKDCSGLSTIADSWALLLRILHVTSPSPTAVTSHSWSHVVTWSSFYPSLSSLSTQDKIWFAASVCSSARLELCICFYLHCNFRVYNRHHCLLYQ
jgi:hypothetical protein